MLLIGAQFWSLRAVQLSVQVLQLKLYSSHNLILTLYFWSALRLLPSHFEWPVTLTSNAWQTSESQGNPPKLLCLLSDLLLSVTHMQSPLLKQSGMSGMLTNIWDTYLPKLCTHTIVQYCMHRAFTLTWFTAEPKKHGRSRHPSWSFLTE